MLTTESLGRPEAAAGRNTLPGITARAVLDVMTAAMVVFSRLALKGLAWMTRTGRRLAVCCPVPRRDLPSRCCRDWSPVVRGRQDATASSVSGGVGVVPGGLQRLVDLPCNRVRGELVKVAAGSASEELGSADAG